MELRNLNGRRRSIWWRGLISEAQSWSTEEVRCPTAAPLVLIILLPTTSSCKLTVTRSQTAVVRMRPRCASCSTSAPCSSYKAVASLSEPSLIHPGILMSSMYVWRLQPLVHLRLCNWAGFTSRRRLILMDGNRIAFSFLFQPSRRRQDWCHRSKNVRNVLV